MTQSIATGTARVRSATASLGGLAVLLALAAYFGLGAERLIEVWRTGAYHDTDDAMRMVQVRDLLARQS